MDGGTDMDGGAPRRVSVGEELGVLVIGLGCVVEREVCT
jgi:hypothetical protein